ncbi:MAG TPA: sigma-70 family RNA polymerase sigma factor [Candidatus Saccharimonadales bacterium]|nr:sigma-70 family RNA polymerase sigma factor [Candidatus Saccharimonadales bacterium]
MEIQVQSADESISLNVSDRELVAAVLGKDRKATAEFVDRYSDAVYNYVRSRLFPYTDRTDDLVQEVFMAAWQQLGSFRAESSLHTWLLAIARHKVQDYYRALLRQPVSLEEPDETAVLISLPQFDDALDAERLSAKVALTMAALSEQYRTALLWRYWENCSVRDMALRTDKTEKAIERLLARARRAFKDGWNHV